MLFIEIFLGICGIGTVLVAKQHLDQKKIFNFIACLVSGGFALGQILERFIA